MSLICCNLHKVSSGLELVKLSVIWCVDSQLVVILYCWLQCWFHGSVKGQVCHAGKWNQGSRSVEGFLSVCLQLCQKSRPKVSGYVFMCVYVCFCCSSAHACKTEHADDCTRELWPCSETIPWFVESLAVKCKFLLFTLISACRWLIGSSFTLNEQKITNDMSLFLSYLNLHAFNIKLQPRYLLVIQFSDCCNFHQYTAVLLVVSVCFCLQT